jgi:polyisoprenoid-binding protein YceI
MAENKELSRIFSGKVFPAPGEYIIDPVHSFSEFAAQHMIVGQVWGRFDSIAGRMVITEDPLSSYFETSIDTASINTHHEDRDKDLRSQRFFDVIKYPKMTFVSTGLKTGIGSHFTLEGNLTIKDVTRPVSLSLVFSGVVIDPWGNTRAAFQTESKVNRKDFGLMADLDREAGGFLIGKDVTIRMGVEALLKKA